MAAQSSRLQFILLTFCFAITINIDCFMSTTFLNTFRNLSELHNYYTRNYEVLIAPKGNTPHWMHIFFDKVINVSVTAFDVCYAGNIW